MQINTDCSALLNQFHPIPNLLLIFVCDTTNDFQALRGADPGTEQCFLLPGALMDQEAGKQREV